MAVILAIWVVLTMVAVTTTRITMDVQQDNMDIPALQSSVEDKLMDVLDYLAANRDDLIADTTMGVSLAAGDVRMGYGKIIISDYYRIS